MLNASVGLQRVLARVLPTRIDRKPSAIRFHRRTVTTTPAPRVRAESVAAHAQVPLRLARVAPDPVRRSVNERVGREGTLAVLVGLIVAVASVLSWLPGMPARGAVGDVIEDAPAPRIAIGGARGAVAAARSDVLQAYEADVPSIGDVDSVAVAAARDPRIQVGDPIEFHPVEVQSPAQRKAAEEKALTRAAAAGARRADPDAPAAPKPPSAAKASIEGPFLADGTLIKPIAVETTVPDGKALLRTWKVRKGDTLAKIADRFDVSVMTVVWANDLASRTDVKVGRNLRIPPVDGLVLDVKEGDTLDAIAKAYDVDADRIYETNRLEDRVLVVGQTLILPGAKGEAIETEMSVQAGGRNGRTLTVRVPARYAGGGFVWPVLGGDNYVSRGFIYGHLGLDIAADYGSRVRAAASGTVIFAGWKSNGGGYQVHLAHGSGLFTTYNHLSGVSVGTGQTVAAGQQVGRIGSSGWATGPHLHFEVWRGGIWNGGRRLNPLAYL